MARDATNRSTFATSAPCIRRTVKIEVRSSQPTRRSKTSLWSGPRTLPRRRSKDSLSEHIASKLTEPLPNFSAELPRSSCRASRRTGWRCDSLVKQAEDYGALARRHLPRCQGRPQSRECFSDHCLQFGTVVVDGGRVTAIVAPWHPLRLAAMANKALASRLAGSAPVDR